MASPGRMSGIDLTAWFAENGRQLPWRQTRDPWEVIVAELMLQQTQVDRVVPRWHRFLKRFPTVDVCAGSPPSSVIDEWSGLGYNRRAINLHRLAEKIVKEHNSRFPQDRKLLLDLPGVGPYTARAVRVFAFECSDAVLDTNVARILARVEGKTLPRSEAQHLADENLGPDPWAWNQALLDVGAGYCRPTPSCLDCPLAPVCSWNLAGRPSPDPAVGSAAVSTKQSKFQGSDRQGRGRLVQALRSGPIPVDEVAATAGWPDDVSRAQKVVESLVADGLVVEREGHIKLPT